MKNSSLSEILYYYFPNCTIYCSRLYVFKLKEKYSLLTFAMINWSYPGPPGEGFNLTRLRQQSFQEVQSFRAVFMVVFVLCLYVDLLVTRFYAVRLYVVHILHSLSSVSLSLRTKLCIYTTLLLLSTETLNSILWYYFVANFITYNEIGCLRNQDFLQTKWKVPRAHYGHVGLS